MPIAYGTNTSELDFTGVVTNAEFESAISSSTTGLSRTGDNIYTLEADLRLKDGCDLSSFRDGIFELDTHDIHINDGSAAGEDAPVDVTWRNVSFIESGARETADRFIFKGDIKYRATAMKIARDENTKMTDTRMMSWKVEDAWYEEHRDPTETNDEWARYRCNIAAQCPETPWPYNSVVTWIYAPGSTSGCVRA